MAQTSDKVSSIAARYRGITGAQVRGIVERGGDEELAKDIRSMANSLARQDEVKGLRKIGRALGLGKSA